MKNTKKEKLLQNFLKLYPNATHPLDRKRFVKYAIACIESKSYIDIDAMKGIVSDTRIEELEFAYSWIREAYDLLEEEGKWKKK